MDTFINCVFLIVQELANALIPAAVSQYMFQGQEAEPYTTAGYEEHWVFDTTASKDPFWEIIRYLMSSTGLNKYLLSKYWSIYSFHLLCLFKGEPNESIALGLQMNSKYKKGRLCILDSRRGGDTSLFEDHYLHNGPKVRCIWRNIFHGNGDIYHTTYKKCGLHQDCFENQGI